MAHKRAEEDKKEKQKNLQVIQDKLKTCTSQEQITVLLHVTILMFDVWRRTGNCGFSAKTYARQKFLPMLV
jgi:hypothetical protein